MQASRKPRRAFAAPLVLTIAMPACVVTSPPPDQTAPPPPPPEQGQPVATRPPQPPPPRPEPAPQPQPTSPPVVVTNPPPPSTQQGTPPDYQRNWTVKLGADGTCKAFVEVHCKKGATCNPPPPKAVACPTGITVDRSMKIFAQAGSWDCYVMPEAAACPEKATCNPPPPRKTACP